MNNNPTGRGGFQDHPELRNNKGAPKKGDRFSDAVNRITSMSKGELLKMAGGPKTKLGKLLSYLPDKIPAKDGMILFAIAGFIHSQDPRMFRELTDRAEGRPAQTIITAEGGGATQPLTIPADLIAPNFFDAYRDLANKRHAEYIFHGGRGSTKSSFVSLAFIYLLVNNPLVHGLAVRQVAATLRESVYNQLVWATDELGVSDDFKCIRNPLEIEYLPTGQKIFFRGADDAGKIKSIKPTFGYIGLVWFEELDQFHGPEQVRKIEQSVRGGDDTYTFKSFNPPPTKNNWANKYVLIPKDNQYQHSSNYLTVPPEWLGRTWLEEAEHLKGVNPAAYDNEYLGLANNEGGMVFTNVRIETITDEQIAQFDRITSGIDWGFYPDPASYGKFHYDAARRILYIFAEGRYWKKSNEALFKQLVDDGLIRKITQGEGKRQVIMYPDLIIGDSAEPKSVADLKAYGANIRGAEKGPESVAYSIKWLQGLTAIVIDQKRAPYHAEEFLNYEYERTKDGEIISEFPDKNNHAIDDTRYGMNMVWRRRGE